MTLKRNHEHARTNLHSEHKLKTNDKFACLVNHNEYQNLHYSFILTVPVWRKRNTWSQQHVCLHRNKLVVQWGLHDPSNLPAGDVS